MVSLGVGELLTFGLLTVALAALWLPSARPPTRPTDGWWLPPAVAAAACGLFYGFLDWRGVAALIAFALACAWLYRTRSGWAGRGVAAAVVLALCAVFLLHLAPETLEQATLLLRRLQAALGEELAAAGGAGRVVAAQARFPQDAESGRELLGVALQRLERKLQRRPGGEGGAS